MLLPNCSCRAAPGSIATATVRWGSCSQALRHGLALVERLALHVGIGIHCFLFDRNETGNGLPDMLRRCPGVLSSNQDVILLTYGCTTKLCDTPPSPPSYYMLTCDTWHEITWYFFADVDDDDGIDAKC